VNKQLPHGSPRRRREEEAETLLKEIIAENFPNLGRDVDIQVHEAQRTPSKINPKKITPRYIIIKMLNCPNYPQ